MARPWGLALAGALLLGSCATAPREPWVLATADLREAPLRDLDRISTYPQALATALDVVQRDLGLPAIEVRLLFLPGAKSLEAVLLGAGHPPAIARESSRTLVAVGGHRLVLVNQPRLEREGGWPARVSTLAHELAHVLQYELAGGERGTSAQWLREGFATWVGAGVLERLGRSRGPQARRQAILRVRSYMQGRVLALGRTGPLPPGVHASSTPRRLPPLDALRSFPAWLAQARGEAGEILHDYAFLAALLLIEQHGTPAVMRYFELSGRRPDPAATFLEVFGECEEQFERRLRRVISP